MTEQMEENTMQPLEEKEATEPTPEAEQPTEATPEPTIETPLGKVNLAEKVKQRLLSCAQDAECLDNIRARLVDEAISSGVPFDELLEEEFGLTKGD